MESLPNVLLLVLMFVLRLGVPLLITVAIAYGLKQLDSKWQAEAEQELPGRSTTVQKRLSQPSAAPVKSRLIQPANLSSMDEHDTLTTMNRTIRRQPEAQQPLAGFAAFRRHTGHNHHAHGPGLLRTGQRGCAAA